MVKHESGMQLVASVIAYIFFFSFFSGKFAVLPTHGFAGDKLVLAGSR